MMYASQNGHVIVLERLVQHGARVDLQTQVYNNVHTKSLCKFTLFNVCRIMHVI